MSIAVKRISQRIRGTEGKKGAYCHLHFGTGYISMLRTGDENTLSRYAWNWCALPGTTLEQGQSTGAGKSQAQNCGANWYSGGVTDGLYGCGGFEQMPVNYMKVPPGQEEQSFEGTELMINGIETKVKLKHPPAGSRWVQQSAESPTVTPTLHENHHRPS